MGSLVSPILAYLYMEYFEQKALSTAPTSQALAEVCGWHICHPEGNVYYARYAAAMKF